MNFRVIFFLLLLCSGNLGAQTLENQLKGLVNSAGQSTAIIVSELESGQVLFTHQAQAPLKPASVMKLLVSSYLLDRLGGAHKFSTKVMYAQKNAGDINSLQVRGGGDPKFVTENAADLVRKIYARGVRSIEDIYIDDSAFLEEHERSGVKAYEAGASAIAFNFNSLEFLICPGSSGEQAVVSTNPWEYSVELRGKIVTASAKKPTYYVDEPEFKQDSYPQIFLLRGAIPSGYPCSSVYRTVNRPAVYFGQTFAGMLNKQGIKLKGQVRHGSNPAASKYLLDHDSQPLSELIRDLNKFSNNFMAEQFLYLAGKISGDKYSRDQGVKNLAAYLQSLGVERGEFQLADGSGLSHDNRLSANALHKILLKSYNDADMRSEFVSSLAVPGEVGTLVRRKGLNGRGTVRAKTGTINGVDSLAGYFFKGNKSYAFVIVQNKVHSHWKATEIENKLLKIMSDKL